MRRRTRILESKAIPGVTVTLFNTSLQRRMELQRMNIEEFRTDGDLSEDASTMGSISKRGLLVAKSNAILLRWAVKDIGGYQVEDDGGQPAPATVDSLILHGDEALVQEILNNIGLDMGITVDQGEPSPSPTTSVAQADGASKDTTA